MISLASSQVKTDAPLAAGTTKAKTGDAKAGAEGFSLLLGTLAASGEPVGETVGKAAAGKGDEASAKGEAGTLLPIVPEGGKPLPGTLPLVPVNASAATEKPAAADTQPGSAQDQKRATDPDPDAAITGEATAAAAAVAMVLPLPAVARLTPVATQSPTGGESNEPSTGKPGLPAPFTGTASANQNLVSQPAPPQAAVALHVASQPSTTVGEQAAQHVHAAPLGHRPDNSGANASLTSAQPEAALQFAAAPSTQASAAPIPAARDHPPAVPANALHDLTRIVDQLSAAREAFAPAAASLTVDHADFGELSLRFDQRRDGQLAVQLSAANPDAHRAVAAAVADHGFSSAGGNHSGAGQPGSQAHMQARAGTADRDGGGTGGSFAERHEQHSHQRPASQDQPRKDQRRAGVFA
jgi:hypothetical protein